MNKAELVSSIAKQTGLSKSKSGEFLDSFVKAISESLGRGEKVSLVGFGTFTTAKREARKGRNPKTGEVIDIQSKTVARFKPGTELSKAVN